MLDDKISITANPDIQSLQYIPKIFQQSFFGNDRFYYRPLVSLSFALEHKLFGLNYFFYNLTNLFLHVATAVVVFFLLSALLRSEAVAFWGAFLFAVHPVQAEAVGNIAGRSILLCGFFELSALLAFVYFWQSQKKGYFFLSLVAFALALLSKESSAVLPLVVFCYAVIFNGEKDKVGGPKKRVFSALKFSAPFFLALGFYFVLRFSLKISRVSFVLDAQDYFCGLLTFVRALGTYARTLLLPVDLHFDRITPVIYHILSVQGIATILGAGAMIFLFVKFFRRMRPAVLFLVFFALMRFLPLSQIIPIRSQAGYICIPDHFLYVPSAALLTLLVLSFISVKKFFVERKMHRLFFIAIVFVWVVFLALTTIEQNIYAANEIAMYRRTLFFTPDHVRINTTLALSYAVDGNFKAAQEYFQKALDREPMNTRARLGLGTTLLDQNLCWEGLAEYDKITDVGDLKDMMEANKNLAYRKLITQYSVMLKKDPENPGIYYSLGVVYAKKGDFEKAVNYFKATLTRDAENTNAQANLCNCYKALGREAEAKECFLRLENNKRSIK